MATTLPPLTDHRSPVLGLSLPSLDNWQEQDVPRMHAALLGVDAFLKDRTNLLPYGGFEDGPTGWMDTSDWQFLNSREWGPIALRTGVGGTVVLTSEHFDVEPGATYTVTGDSLLFSHAGGAVYFDLVFFDEVGHMVGDGSENAIGAGHNFGELGTRLAHATQATAPPTGVYARARFVAQELIGSATIGCRRIKVERGALPATSYSNEASVVRMADRLAAAEETLANTGTSLVPAGVVVHFAAELPPGGWLAANGAAISRTAYAALFAAIGTTYGVGDGASTFNVPDLRGEFIRGFDGGRGVDAGRAFGSSQGDQNQSHSHTATTDSAGAHTHTMTARNYSTTYGANMMGGNLTTGANGVVSGSSGSHTHNLNVQSSGGSEARPRNVALLPCIKF